PRTRIILSRRSIIAGLACPGIGGCGQNPVSPRIIERGAITDGGMQTTVLRIGTRGSPLALSQAHVTPARLMAAHGVPKEAFPDQVIATSGDRIQDRPLSEAGGKALFTKEIEEVLLAGRIDLAVHS